MKHPTPWTIHEIRRGGAYVVDAEEHAVCYCDNRETAKRIMEAVNAREACGEPARV